MSLTDVMSGAGLWVFPSVALVIFASVFAAAVWRAFSRSGEHARAHAARLPLEDAPIRAMGKAVQAGKEKT